jgi:EF hand
MWNWVRCCTLLFVGLLALPALAQPPDDPGKDGGPPPRHGHNPEVRQKLLELFDHNKDGTLDRNELMELRMTIREEFAPAGPGPEGRGMDGRGPRDGRDGDRRGRDGRDGRGPDARGPDGPPPGGPDRFADRGRDGWRHDGDARGPDGPPPGGPGRDGPDARGPEGRRGPGGPDGRPPRPRPNPEALFKRFDANKDGQLSMEEFGQLTEFVREHRPMGPPPGPEGRRFGRGGPDGQDGPPRGRDRRDGPPPGADDRPPPGPDGPPPRAADDEKPGVDQSSSNDLPSDDELSLEDAI